MLQRAEERMLLADHSKFGEPHLEVICPLGEINRLVSDRPPGRELAAALRRAKVEVHS
jgi:DeoR/GlpR family transcriptional regulator of sugar metabolism